MTKNIKQEETKKVNPTKEELETSAQSLELTEPTDQSPEEPEKWKEIKANEAYEEPKIGDSIYLKKVDGRVIHAIVYDSLRVKLDDGSFHWLIEYKAWTHATNVEE